MAPIEKLFDLHPLGDGPLYGLELEIEDVSLQDRLPKEWEVKADGSLRNNGQEFVSKPLEIALIRSSLQALFKTLQLTELSYSDRTSIHVHCNMHGLSSEQVKSMALLYLFFEPVFFSFVDKSRHKNIFCVGLNQFDSPQKLHTSFYLPDFAQGITWEKYSAFNLLPLQQFGTIEFRHMHGTDNIEQIVDWVGLIDILKTNAVKQTYTEWLAEILVLKSSKSFDSFANKVFGNRLSCFAIKHNCYKQVKLIKLWEFLNQEKQKAKKAVKKNLTATRSEGVATIQELMRQLQVPSFEGDLSNSF